MATVWLLEVRQAGTPACFRLVSDGLPAGADDVKVALSTSPGGCMTPITQLHTHDYHAAGTNEAYVSRVVEDVRKAVKALDWKGGVVPTGYRFHKIEV